MTTPKQYTPDDSIYWASQSPDDIGPAIAEHFRRYAERATDDGRLAIWRTADRTYHGRNPDGGYSNAHAVTFGGTQGEVAQIHIGHFRQIVGSQLTIATESRPAVECTATSNDPEALSDTIVARQVLEYDLDEGGLEQDVHAAHELALTMAEGYLVQDWDFNAGELIGTRTLEPAEVDEGDGIPDGARKPAMQALDGMIEQPANDNGTPMDGEQADAVDIPVREGAIRVRVHGPMDVAHDLDRDPRAEAPWYIVRDRVNRWELAARFPEDAEKRQAILDAPGVDDDSWALNAGMKRGAESDYVHRYTLYHPPSDALPMGRLVEMVDEEWLYDQPYPFDHMVVHEDVPSRQLDKPVGYGDAWDMLAVSQALDASESGMLSVADQGAHVKYQAPRGMKVDTRALDQGMTLNEYDDQGIPGSRGIELMNRPEVRPSDLNYAGHQRQTLELLSGINATVRGAAESEVKSGADRALIATMAVRANSKHQRSLAKLMRSVLNGRVKLYKMFCGEERLVEIAGRDKSGHVATFSAKTLENVRRVRVDIGPPELRMTEGKMALADKMIESYGPEVITPDRYMALRLTGRLDEIDNLIAEHKVNARRENDLCRDGKGEQLQVLVSDHHACHIREHLRELNDPAIRFDASKLVQIQTLTQHITAHAMMWPQTPPEILAATGQDPAPSTLMGQPPGGGGPPPAGPPMPPGAPPPMPPANDNGMPSEMGGPNGPRLPSMPMVPGTGERYSPGQAPPGAAA